MLSPKSRDLPRCDLVHDLTAEVLMRLDPLDLGCDFLCAPADVFVHGRDEIFVPYFGIVEIGQNFVKLRGVKFR